jgi:hypothetical protein
LQVVWLLYWHWNPLKPLKQVHWPLPLIPSLQKPLPPPPQACPLNVGHGAQLGP